MFHILKNEFYVKCWKSSLRYKGNIIQVKNHSELFLRRDLLKDKKKYKSINIKKCMDYISPNKYFQNLVSI